MYNFLPYRYDYLRDPKWRGLNKKLKLNNFYTERLKKKQLKFTMKELILKGDVNFS